MPNTEVTQPCPQASSAKIEDFYYEANRFLAIASEEWQYAAKLLSQGGISAAIEGHIQKRIHDRYQKDRSEQADIDYPDLPPDIIFPD